MPKRPNPNLAPGFTETLSSSIKGTLHTDDLSRAMYATDASIYREWPLGVVYPKDEADLITIVKTCAAFKIPIIPRTAGTSLAGQCVGEGLVLDVSKFLTNILEFDAENGIVKVQPGVVRDELNTWLKDSGWWFAPNTSTSNRCMIGGMVGNNSSGTTSIKYGVTRDKVLAIKAILHDGTTHEFKALHSGDTPHPKESALKDLLADGIFRQKLHEAMPDPRIHRRNTGYALEALSKSSMFESDGHPWNTAALLCGSEGTLCVFSEITLQLDKLPPPQIALVAIHFESIRACMEATVAVMQFAPYACELMDKTILDCTKENLEQRENRFFVDGDPKAILVVELRGDTPEDVASQAQSLILELTSQNMGYAWPIITGAQTQKVWALRAAGLGLLANIPGPRKALACIEDTAVSLEVLPNYIEAFEQIMLRYNQQAVYYAHAGAGEIHLRPILNLRDPKELAQFSQISHEVAMLVKKFNGTLSGEHGDGRVRAPFIAEVVGEEVYKAFEKVKHIFDPDDILNPGKIVNPKPLESDLREDPEHPLKSLDSFFDFGNATGFHEATEKCNGSGDCRKSAQTGGTMCPSYQATKTEQHTTRARANALREFIRNTEDGQQAFNHPELKEVLDLCLSCKGCTRECPSNVDMSTMKAEWQYQYYQYNRRPLAHYLMGHLDKWAPMASALAPVFNAVTKWPLLDRLVKKSLGVAISRKLPGFASQSLFHWFAKNQKIKTPQQKKGVVYLFFDEFTNYQEPHIGKSAVELLWQLGYEVRGIKHAPSGRGQLSKGFLKTAAKYAAQNTQIFAPLINAEVPLIGIEPSAILGFRDEYPKLLRGAEQNAAIELSTNCLMLEEFLFQELRSGRLHASDFPQRTGRVLLHGHCHQKALSSLRPTKRILEACGYEVRILPTGCCGMAGSFGYEADHHEVSMQIGELVLFPELRKAEASDLVVAIGTSCRHQIADGVGKQAVHWVSLLA
jgi:FAD/FMN-containing dehydrogenase/Fe-S oxidoreductase